MEKEEWKMGLIGNSGFGFDQDESRVLERQRG
jgi:hypothetical protein